MKKPSLCIFFILMWINIGITEEQNIIGRSWTISESEGDIYIFKFNKENKCTYVSLKSYSGNEGIIYDNCEWSQNGNAIVFHMNNFFMIRTAIIDGYAMEGYFVSAYKGGVKGSFTGTKN